MPNICHKGSESPAEPTTLRGAARVMARSSGLTTRNSFPLFLKLLIGEESTNAISTGQPPGHRANGESWSIDLKGKTKDTLHILGRRCRYLLESRAGKHIPSRERMCSSPTVWKAWSALVYQRHWDERWRGRQ